MYKRLININNSFSIYESNDKSIWMDPWVNDANEGAWASLLDDKESHSLASGEIFRLPNIIYISHLHSDHFDPIFLKQVLSHKNDIVFLIKNYKDKRLFSKLVNEVKVKNIIEIDELKWRSFLNLSFFLIPQFHSSSTSEITLVNYDLDTSLVIHDNDVLLFNEVDNPLSIDDYVRILNCSDIMSLNCKYRIGLLGYSGASDYPQSYLGINRIGEREKIITRFSKRFEQIYTLLKLDIAIPAGGTYYLQGYMNSLNQYKAVPDFDEFSQKIGKNINLINPKLKEIFIDNALECIDRVDILPRKPIVDLEQSNSVYKENKFILKKDLQRKFHNIEVNLSKKLIDLYAVLKTEITFIVYRDPPIFNDIANLEQLPFFTFKLFKNIKLNKPKEISLNIHIESNMLMEILDGNKIWNECTYHCVYERVPNIYEPDAMFFLNLYKRKIL